MCLSLLVRSDLLAALARSTGTERDWLKRATAVFCPLHRLGDWLKLLFVRASARGPLHAFAARTPALLPLAFMGFVDPAEAAGAGRYIWATDEFTRAVDRQRARVAVLCASVTGAMIPGSIWWLFFWTTCLEAKSSAGRISSPASATGPFLSSLE